MVQHTRFCIKTELKWSKSHSATASLYTPALACTGKKVSFSFRFLDCVYVKKLSFCFSLLFFNIWWSVHLPMCLKSRKKKKTSSQESFCVFVVYRCSSQSAGVMNSSLILLLCSLLPDYIMSGHITAKTRWDKKHWIFLCRERSKSSQWKASYYLFTFFIQYISD